MLVNPGGLAKSQIPSKSRAMTPADLLTRQALRETAFSPDGKWAALVVERPRRVGESYERGYLRGLERTDIWLASTDGKKLLNVTRGEAVHAGHWNPVWSPDSKRLAMVSTRGDNIRAYIYDLNTQHLRACITDGLDLDLRIEVAESEASNMVWLSPNQLLLGVLPPGIRPLAMDETERTSRITAKAIAEVKRGRGVTASILDTEAVDHSPTQQKNVALSLVDMVTNKARVLARLPLVEVRLSQRIVSISPNRAYAAIMATGYPNRVAPDRRIRSDDMSPLRLGVAALQKTNETPVWVEKLQPVKFGLGGTPTSIRWAPTGNTFALIGMSNRDELPAPGVFTVKADDKEPKAISSLRYDESPDAQFLTAEDIEWAANGELLVYGYAGTGASLRAEVSQKDVRGFGRDNNKENARRDWWIIFSPNSYHNLTRELTQSPRLLFKTRNSNVMYGVSGGRIWAVDAGSRKVKTLNLKETAPASLVWPRPTNAHRPVDELIVSYARDAGTDLFRLDLSAAAPVSMKLGTIPRAAVFTGYSPSRQLIAYETDVNEIRLISQSASEPITLISVNRQLDTIAKPQYRTVQYQTGDGQHLSGALLLPYGYAAGHKYPLIVYVYGGSLAPTGDWASPYKSVSRGLIDPLILAGRGYAVLIPSVPLESMDKPSDPMLDLDKGVKPAIDKVVELGIADIDRIGLMGHSYGGYSVYSLVTKTQRFKAAVAYAGFTDLLSLHGSLDPRYRFNDVMNLSWGPYFLESQQARMGVPPWKDLDRYLRNSPYVHADKVTTPLLMIHGDLDAIPLSQAEQFFIALNRLGKRAKLVRYLAEGHIIESPGNTIDMWENILNWFDEYLQTRQLNQSAKKK